MNEKCIEHFDKFKINKCVTFQHNYFLNYQTKNIILKIYTGSKFKKSDTKKEKLNFFAKKKNNYF